MKSKRIRRKYLYLILACSVMLTVGVILLFFSYYAVYKVYDLRMSLIVSNHSAFNIDPESINFGTSSPGNSNSRTIVLSHDYSKPLLIHFKSSGNISGFVSLPADFYLQPHLAKEVTLSANTPLSPQQGYYEGRLLVYFRRI